MLSYRLNDADFWDCYNKHSRNLALALLEPILETHKLPASRGKGLAWSLWRKKKKKKAVTRILLLNLCCSNVYVFITKNNIHGQVILDFFSEKNNVKASPKWHNLAEGQPQLRWAYSCRVFPNVLAVLPYCHWCVSPLELSSDED